MNARNAFRAGWAKVIEAVQLPEPPQLHLSFSQVVKKDCDLLDQVQIATMNGSSVVTAFGCFKCNSSCQAGREQVKHSVLAGLAVLRVLLLGNTERRLCKGKAAWLVHTAHDTWILPLSLFTPTHPGSTATKRTCVKGRPLCGHLPT